MSNPTRYLTLVKTKPHVLALAACLLLGGGLRLVGLTRGVSDFDPAGRAGQTHFYHFHPDEETLVRAALALESPLAPPLTAYGLLPLYALRGGLALAGAWPGAPALDLATTEGRIWVFTTGRVLAVLASWASLVLVYWLGRRCYGAWAGVLAAYWVAVAPVAVQQAHFYTVDGAFVFLSLAFFCALARVLQDEGDGWAVLAGVCIGATAAVRLNGVLLGAVLGGALLARGGGRWPRPLALGGAAAALTLVLLQPYLVTQPALLWRSETSDDLAYSLAIARGEILKPWSLFDADTTPYIHYWSALMPLAVGWAATALMAAGLVAGWRRREPLPLAVVGWALVCFLLVGGLYTKHVRYLLPLLPFVALAAADLCLWALGRWRAAGAVVAAALISAGWYGVAFAGIYAGEDSRVRAGRWIVAQVPAGATIGVERGGFSLGSVIDEDRYREQPLAIARLFNGRPYLSCGAAARFLGQRLRKMDYIALADANRLAHFAKAPPGYPALASFYTRLAAGELGFAPAARFKRYPAWAGLRFADDGVEPSFIGYDHPAVLVLARGDAGAALAQWERALAADPRCPDAALEEIGGLVAAGRDQEALAANQRLAARFAHWQLPHLVATWIHARRGEREQEMLAVGRFREGLLKTADAHYGPWAGALSFARAGMPDLALTALGEGALQVRQYPTPAPVRRAMADSYGEIAALLARQGRARHAEAARQLAAEVAP